MKNIYILLSRTNTSFANLVHLVTADAYTHASISLDRELTKLYSFARKNERFLLPAGFIKENIHTGIFKKYEECQCVLYSLKVTNKSYNKVEKILHKMCANPDAYSYNVVGVILCKLGIVYEKDNCYFCSEFVSHLLEKSGAIKLPKECCFMRPVDFYNMPKLKKVYEGKIKYADEINSNIQPSATISNKALA
ncbi:MAG: hypothetical protein RSE93_04345 [Oscillospiraceae bacterium]